MSSTSAVGDSGKVSGQRMSFSQTCNLLSQYVKEKRAISLSPNPAEPRGDGYNRATMNLFPVSGGKTDGGEDSNGCVGRTINLFPHNPSLGADRPLMANGSGTKRVSTEPPAPQMTIFYGGQVLVFNDLPADKAKEVMDLASNYESSQKKRKVEPTNLGPPSPMPISNASPSPNLKPSQNMNVGPNFGQSVIPATAARPSIEAIVSDLPIARKASLHRFLEKRKDRLVAKVPPSSDANNGGPAKPVEGKSWLGLGSLPVFQPQQQL